MPHRLCENCGLYFGQEKAYCKLCGHPLAGSALSAPTKICPQCHLLHGAVSPRCVFCSGELHASGHAPAAAPTVPRPAPEKRPAPLPPRVQAARPPVPVPGSWPAAPSPAPAPGSAVPDRAQPPASRFRPLLSSVWMDWKILAALAVIPLVILTATLLALQPGGSQAVPARAPSVQDPAAEAERLNAHGIAAVREGRTAEAERAFLAALVADPKSPKARNNLGILYRRLGRTEEAIVMYGQAIALDPANPVPHKNLGLIYEEQGRRAEALRHFEQYRTLRPDAPDADEIKRKIARLRRV